MVWAGEGKLGKNIKRAFAFNLECSLVISGRIPQTCINGEVNCRGELQN